MSLWLHHIHIKNKHTHTTLVSIHCLDFKLKKPLNGSNITGMIFLLVKVRIGVFSINLSIAWIQYKWQIQSDAWSNKYKEQIKQNNDLFFFPQYFVVVFGSFVQNENFGEEIWFVKEK